MRDDNRSRGFRGGGGARSFGRRPGPREERQMFKAVCSNCGKDCEVPFKPTGEKPVYCNECFEKLGLKSERANDRRPRFDDRGPRRDFGNHNNHQMDEINAKLDKILEMLQATGKVN